ncbi:hypothetical protein [Paracoccus xiamenensis]|uniref:hypothetical protein n=1 Tax=Paracoccus xiamenensis TaxID=2714901 RepID=UPI001407C82A|nr:hypothetical protein [Paracoccus xiamenensis]NHF72241.1 hypothetical protein [Paracoccus xiamenensis]
MFLTDILSFLDARSFSSPWFWAVLLTVWTLSGRRVVGIPVDVPAQAARALREQPGEASAEVFALLDWMSLSVPRWQAGPRTGAVLTALICFALSVLAILGFSFGLEMAQALVLIGLPQALLLALRARLAGQLYWVLEAAELGQPAAEAAAEALRRINRYRILHGIISVLAVVVTAFWASLWMLMHPNGL